MCIEFEVTVPADEGHDLYKTGAFVQANQSLGWIDQWLIWRGWMHWYPVGCTGKLRAMNTYCIFRYLLISSERASFHNNLVVQQSVIELLHWWGVRKLKDLTEWVLSLFSLTNISFGQFVLHFTFLIRSDHWENCLFHMEREFFPRASRGRDYLC